MSTNIRRMALDLGPVFIFLVAIEFFAGIFINTGWLNHTGASLYLSPGLFYIVAMFGGIGKTPIWQTLPVTRKEIGRARWWQAVGGPAVLIAAALCLPALVLAGLGRLHESWGDIGLVFSGQFAVMTMTAILSAAVATGTRKWGRGAGVLLILLAFMARFIFPVGTVTAHLRLLLAGAGMGAVAGAIILLLLTGYWEPSTTVAPWTSSNRRMPQNAKTRSLSFRGWAAIVGMIAPMFGSSWLLTPLVALAAKSLFGDFVATYIAYFLFIMPTTAISLVATNIRFLRGLPFAGYALTLRLVLFQLLVQAISLAVLTFTFFLLHLPSPQPLLATALLAAPGLFFPFILRFDDRIVVFGVGCFVAAFSAIAGFTAKSPPLHMPLPTILIGTLAVMAAGFAWSYWEIVHGRSAYRARPLIAPRWRGRG